eukprot:6207771-Pleurochrysis_carterae.AAC.1
MIVTLKGSVIGKVHKMTYSVTRPAPTNRIKARAECLFRREDGWTRPAAQSQITLLAGVQERESAAAALVCWLTGSK